MGKKSRQDSLRGFKGVVSFLWHAGTKKGKTISGKTIL